MSGMDGNWPVDILFKGISHLLILADKPLVAKSQVFMIDIYLKT